MALDITSADHARAEDVWADGVRPGSTRRRGGVHAIVLGCGVLLLCGVLALSIVVGSGDLSIVDAWRLLWHPAAGHDGLVVHTLRLPRTLMGLLAGIALAVAGVLMQALTRNPLADPGIFGVNAGAAACTVIGVAVLGIQSFTGYVWCGLFGAALASFATFLLAARASTTPVRLALAGTAVSAVLTALTNAFVYLDAESFERYRFWVVGSLSVPELGVVQQVLPFVLAGVVLALVIARSLDVLSLGADGGAGLGARPGRVRAIGVLAVALLCGAVTAAAGPITFVGLALPHLMRAITGPNHRLLLLYCLVFAPMLLLSADILGRVVVSGRELEISIVTALVGGPVFLYIARRKRLAEL